MGGNENILTWTLGVYAYGFERPSAIQQRAIMPIIKGKFGLSNLEKFREFSSNTSIR